MSAAIDTKAFYLSRTEYLNAIVETFKEVAAVSLGYAGAINVTENSQDTMEVFGAGLNMSSQYGSWRLELLSSFDSRNQLARALLAMEPEEEDPNEEDAIGAVSEVLNIIAGGVKKRLSHLDPSLKLGLPEPMHCHLPRIPPPHIRVRIDMGIISAHIVTASN